MEQAVAAAIEQPFAVGGKCYRGVTLANPLIELPKFPKRRRRPRCGLRLRCRPRAGRPRQRREKANEHRQPPSQNQGPNHDGTSVATRDRRSQVQCGSLMALPCPSIAESPSIFPLPAYRSYRCVASDFSRTFPLSAVEVSRAHSDSGNHCENAFGWSKPRNGEPRNGDRRDYSEQLFTRPGVG
jgi:hypothetical protein